MPLFCTLRTVSERSRLPYALVNYAQVLLHCKGPPILDFLPARESVGKKTRKEITFGKRCLPESTKPFAKFEEHKKVDFFSRGPSGLVIACYLRSEDFSVCHLRGRSFMGQHTMPPGLPAPTVFIPFMPGTQYGRH